mmetsp:Transcript_5778/g.8964  ORF Transcript_5778/g.8964 Transcript_5778/m.8964 type:complete len:92 (+) Transcript_5778:351-626(+)
MSELIGIFRPFLSLFHVHLRGLLPPGKGRKKRPKSWQLNTQAAQLQPVLRLESVSAANFEASEMACCTQRLRNQIQGHLRYFSSRIQAIMS